jgi:phenylalanyl-tRNA synthetase beta chain
MKFSANWLNEYLKKPLKPQEMAELLTMYAFEVESCEKFGNDFVLDIKVLPDRAHDCLSHIGIAKELAAISGIEFAPPKAKFIEDKKFKAQDFILVDVSVKDLCPRYSMMAVVDAKVGPSPKSMQERLIACGLRPINNIVDIANFVMLETGQPLHAFDAGKLSSSVAASGQQSTEQSREIDSSFLDELGVPRKGAAKKIIVRRAQKDEKIITLDEGRPERTLNENILVIADDKKAIGIAGIKGGKGPEIDEKTKQIVVEAANFEPINIRRGSAALGLRTDASARFENGLDPNLTIPALKRCVGLISQLAGGKVVSGAVDIYPKKINAGKILLNVKKTQSLIGVKISQKEIAEILKKIDLSPKIRKKGKNEFLEVTIPTIRLDLKMQEDLIEEISRLYGYEKIPALMPSSVIVPAVKNENMIWQGKIKDILVGLGYSEAYNYSFFSGAEKKLFKFSEAIEIKNPLSQDQKYLRVSLAGGLLKNVKENLKHFSSVRLFELGRVFYEKGAERAEENKIAAIISHKENNPGGNFFELKGVAEILLEKLGIADIWFDDAIGSNPFWLGLVHPARRAEIKSGNELIGWAGEAKPEILTALEIKERAAIFEFDFKKLITLASEEREYAPPSKHPAIIRDLAVVVESNTKIDEVLNIIETAGGPLLFDSDLFDIYEGLAGGKKSLAFCLIFQSDERNLTDVEINQLMEKIIKATEGKGWEIRK